MNLKAFVTAASLSSAAALAPAMANDDSGFSALQGVDAQILSSAEMTAIAGELNAYDIAAALYAEAAKLAKYPKLAAAATKAADFDLKNAVAINAAFAKLHILTACKSSLCP